MIILALALAAAGLGYSVLTLTRGRRPHASVAPRNAAATSDAEREAAERIATARTDALAMRERALEEIAIRNEAATASEASLEELDRILRERNYILSQRRFAHKKRREEIDARTAALVEQQQQMTATLAARAELDAASARQTVLERVEAECTSEHSQRVEQAVAERLGDVAATTRMLIVEAIQRQDGSHADSAPRLSPMPLEPLTEEGRTRFLAAVQEIAENTSTEVSIDAERALVALRGIDPVGREVARQASLETLERRLSANEVAPLLIRTRQALQHRITDLGERALWEMDMSGRPELAELAGTLHYRFSYGQNALLHCKETGFLCGVLAAELGLDQKEARRAGMLHDIGKAVDHSVEGSHAVIGGELLRLFGTPDGIVHAVKAHHFDEDPSTNLAFLTICADAISASRPGARRDTLATYLARLEQLQEIATRHAGVERAFPMQAGREVRIVVKPSAVNDSDVPLLTHTIAKEIESEMTYPGTIKVTVIREMMATATAPAQLVPVHKTQTSPAEAVTNIEVAPEKKEHS